MEDSVLFSRPIVNKWIANYFQNFPQVCPNLQACVSEVSHLWQGNFRHSDLLYSVVNFSIKHCKLT